MNRWSLRLAFSALAAAGCGAQTSAPGTDTGINPDKDTQISYNRPANCPATWDLVSDFEEGAGMLVQQGSMHGWWYVFSDSQPGTLIPAPAVDGPIAATPLPDGEQSECHKFALHSAATGHDQWAGFGASFRSTPQGKLPMDLSAYTGISFRIKGSTPNTPIWFELITKENQPPEYGGTAQNRSADQHNTRGRLLTKVGSDWTTISIPFSTAAPRYLPAGCAAGVFCEAPAFVPNNALGLQFAVYPQFSNNDEYDVWVDDVRFFNGSDAYGSYTQAATANFKFPRENALTPYCKNPSKASGLHLIEMYNQWKATFVTSDGAAGGLRVRRPENNNDSVSEGIAYGMLIAVYMNDQTLFDGLWKYWSAHTVANTPLMQWQVDAKGQALGTTSASDADEDAAFALIQASEQWSTDPYKADALNLIQAIFKHDVDSSSFAMKPGNASQGTALLNPSYFAPAYYRAFKRLDPSNAWESVTATSYSLLAGIAGPKGLVPGWCGKNCTSAGGGGHQEAAKFQWDAHRIPWRIGMDYCWYGTEQARAYLDKITSFFVGESRLAGVGNLADVYELDGAKAQGGKMNAMSLVGSVAVGAMGATPSNDNTSFVQRGYQFLLDASYTSDPPARAPATAVYSYYNATMGLLTALTLTSQFTDFSMPGLE